MSEAREEKQTKSNFPKPIRWRQKKKSSSSKKLPDKNPLTKRLKVYGMNLADSSLSMVFQIRSLQGKERHRRISKSILFSESHSFQLIDSLISSSSSSVQGHKISLRRKSWLNWRKIWGSCTRTSIWKKRQKKDKQLRQMSIRRRKRSVMRSSTTSISHSDVSMKKISRNTWSFGLSRMTSLKKSQLQ